jgi:hypothetical protein
MIEMLMWQITEVQTYLHSQIMPFLSRALIEMCTQVTCALTVMQIAPFYSNQSYD